MREWSKAQSPLGELSVAARSECAARATAAELLRQRLLGLEALCASWRSIMTGGLGDLRHSDYGQPTDVHFRRLTNAFRA